MRDFLPRARKDLVDLALIATEAAPGLDRDLAAGGDAAAGMLDPILAGNVRSVTWDGADGRWKR